MRSTWFGHSHSELSARLRVRDTERSDARQEFQTQDMVWQRRREATERELHGKTCCGATQSCRASESHVEAVGPIAKNAKCRA
jgi:hypothetical protein